MADLADQLRAEYALLQGHYEAFDARALTIKSWAAPLLAGGLGLGLKESSIELVTATALASICLWWLEGIWKNFQYCYIARIKLLERYFRGETGEQEIKPFQVFESWGAEWQRRFKKPKALRERLRSPFVFLPYLPILVASIAAAAWLAADKIGISGTF